MQMLKSKLTWLAVMTIAMLALAGVEPAMAAHWRISYTVAPKGFQCTAAYTQNGTRHNVAPEIQAAFEHYQYGGHGYHGNTGDYLPNDHPGYYDGHDYYATLPMLMVGAGILPHAPFSNGSASATWTINAVLKWVPDYPGDDAQPPKIIYYREWAEAYSSGLSYGSRDEDGDGYSDVENLPGVSSTVDNGCDDVPVAAQYNHGKTVKGIHFRTRSNEGRETTVELPSCTFRGSISAPVCQSERGGSASVHFLYQVSLQPFWIDAGANLAYTPHRVDLPEKKEIDAWVKLGFRPNPPGEGLWGALGDWAAVYGEGVDNTAVNAPQPFWDGAATYSLYGTLDGLDGNADTLLYKWTSSHTDLYIPPQVTEEQLPHYQIDPSTADKNFHFDFGDVTKDSIQEFPRTTVVRGRVVKPGAGASPNETLGPGEVKVNWHLKPTTLYSISVSFQSSEEITDDEMAMALAEEHVWRTQLGCKISHTIATTALNTLYIEPAQDLLMAPAYVAGGYAASRVVNKVANIVGPLAGNMRAALAARKTGAGLADDVTVTYQVTVEEVQTVGSINKAYAKTHAGEFVAKAGDARQSAVQAADNAGDLATQAERTADKADDVVEATRATNNAERLANTITHRDRARAAATKARNNADQAREATNEAITEERKVQEALQEIERLSDKFSDGAQARGQLEAARRATKAAGEATEKAGDLTRATAQQSRRVRAGAANASDEARAAGANQQVVDLAQTEINKIDQLKDSTLAIGNTAKGSGRATVEAVTDKATRQKRLNFPGGCFVAGTPIVMGDGTLLPIEKLRVGDEVLSRDPVSGAVAAKRVTRTTIRHKVPTLVLHLADGQAIETTANHPFFIGGAKAGESLVVPAGQLELGNSILTRAGPSLSLTRIEPTQEVKTVYNCTVEGFHTYFVGTSVQNALWVHNVDCGELPGHAYDVPGWLMSHQNWGGHTITTHVGKTDAELLQRYLEQGGEISAASSFSDLATAQSVIVRTLDDNTDEIADWLQYAPDGDTYTLSYHGTGVIGRGVGADEIVADRTNATIVLRATGDGTYIVWSAFPS